LGSDTERKTIRGINPTEPQIIPFEPFDQLPALRWWHRRDLLVVQFERGRRLNLPPPAPSFHWLVGVDGLGGCAIQRRQSIWFSCPSPRYRAESVFGVRPAV